MQEVLNAIEKAIDVPSTRNRMTHLECVNERDIHRFQELVVIADFQVTGVYTPPVQLYML